MASITIDRFRARYRSPLSERSRLHRITVDALDRSLEDAVDRASVPASGYLCIRRLDTSVRLSLREPDDRLAERMASAIAAAIAAARTDPSAAKPGGAIVYFTSRTHALCDAITSAMRGQFDRSWAWNQVGIWTTDFPVGMSSAAALVLRMLAREPQHAAAVVAHVAAIDPPIVAALASRGRGDLWIAVAQAVVRAASASQDVVAAIVAGALEESGRLSPMPAPSSAVRAEALAARVFQRSAIVHALQGIGEGAIAPDATRALCLIAVAQFEPALIASKPPLLTAIVDVLHRAIAADVNVGCSNATSSAAETAAEPRSERAADVTMSPRDPSPRDPIDDEDVAGDVPVDVRKVASTRYGGLLYLLNIAARLDLAERVAADPRILPRRGLRWLLHQLGMALTGAEASDAAVLAFAGLGPDAKPPSIDQAGANETELAAVDEYRADVERALVQRLRRAGDAAATALGDVCRRNAVIAADPGWIDVRFPLADVTSDIRRAGLDLDPGWLPWLGVVVRFVYE